MTIFYFRINESGSKLYLMKRLQLAILILLALVASVSSASAQDFSDEFPRAVSLYARGQRLMQEGNFLSAIDVFAELSKGFKNSENRDLYQYSLARAYYHNNDLANASSQLSNFSALFPSSGLLPFAHQMRANCLYRRGRLESAFLLYMKAYSMARSDRLRDLSERSLLAAVDAGYLPTDSVLGKLPGDLACPVKSRVAKLMTGLWGQEKIDSLLDGCKRATAKKRKKSDSKNGGMTLGMLLPTSGPYSKFGQSILDGALLAAELLGQRRIPIEILVYDTRADHVTAMREALALADKKVDLAVGPLLSNVAATVAAGLSEKLVPLLVPAASQAGFTDLSPTCFQMTPNMSTIGRGMAQYAVRHRGMTTLAVITPTTVDELNMAEAFAAEATRLGARILALEKYRPGETDFGPYIKDIKSSILGPIGDSVFFETLGGDTLRAGEVPVSFDGLFMTSGEEDLSQLLPQLNFYRVTASYLGADEWNSSKVLKLGEKVLKDAVFYSSQAAMDNSLLYEKFATVYDAKFGVAPNRLNALGFDAVNILYDAWRDKRRGPGDVAEFLHSLVGYEAASGRITFGKMRTNLELPLFTIRDGLVKPLVERPRVEEPAAPQPDSIGTEYIKYEY